MKTLILILFSISCSAQSFYAPKMKKVDDMPFLWHGKPKHQTFIEKIKQQRQYAIHRRRVSK